MRQSIIYTLGVVLFFGSIYGLLLYFAVTCESKIRSEGIETFGIVRKVKRSNIVRKETLYIIEYCDTANVRCEQVTFGARSIKKSYNVGDLVKIKYLPEYFGEPVLIEEEPVLKKEKGVHPQKPKD